MHRFHPLGRMGKPEQIARCFLFLASDEACERVFRVVGRGNSTSDVRSLLI